MQNVNQPVTYRLEVKIPRLNTSVVFRLREIDRMMASGGGSPSILFTLPPKVHSPCCLLVIRVCPKEQYDSFESK